MFSFLATLLTDFGVDAELALPFIDAWIARIGEILPKIAGAAIILIIGWIAGRLIGNWSARILDRAGLDDALRKTAIGKALEKTRIRIAGFFELVIRWFVYLIAALAAADVLQISTLSRFIDSIVEYLPNFVGGIFIILIGFIIADFVGDALIAVSKEGNIEYGAVFGNALKVFLYFVVIVIGLSTMKIDVQILNVFATALAWGCAVGVGVGLGIAIGLGFKDVVAKKANAWLEQQAETKEKTES
jgi:small-conductance mechanosensitive channel